MDAFDPAAELDVASLRVAVRELVDEGRVLYVAHASQRSEERQITAAHVEATLRSGSPRTEGFERGAWRYRCEGRGIAVIFAFDIDDEGNLLVVITAWRLG